MDAALDITINPSGAKVGGGAVNGVLNSIKVNAIAVTGVMKSRFGALKSTLFSLQTAIAGLGVGLLSKSFIDAASTSENFRTRLNRMLGSVEKGNKLFDNMSKFAGEVSFGFDEIMGSATTLSGILEGGVDEITDLMPLIADLAAAYDLTIAETTDNIVRMFSAGAASADLFQQRGINSMLGFKAGVSVSVEESRKTLEGAWLSPASKFRGMAKELATDWKGLISMYGDEWFSFRNKVMGAGVFEFMKASMAELLDIVKGSEKDLDIFAKSISDMVISGIKSLTINIAKALDMVGPLFKSTFTVVKESFNSAYNVYKELPDWIKPVGLIGAFMFGKKGAVGLIATLAAIDFAQKWLTDMFEKNANAVNEMDYRMLVEQGKITEQIGLDYEQRASYASKYRREEEERLNPSVINKSIENISTGLPNTDKLKEIAKTNFEITTEYWNGVDTRREESRKRTEDRKGLTGIKTGGSAVALEDDKEALEEAKEAQKRYNDALSVGQSIYERLRTPQEKYRDILLELKELVDEGGISEVTAGRARIEAANKLTEELNNQNLELIRQKELAQDLEYIFGNTFSRAISEGLSFKEVLEDLTKQLFNMIVQQQVIQPMSESLGASIANLLPGAATGGAFTVDGTGGTDSQLVAFNATPGERVTIETPGQQASNKGGGVTIVNQNHISISDNREIDQKIQSGIRQAESSSYSRVLNDLRSNGPLRKAIG